MKRLYLLSLAVFTVFSCGSDKLDRSEPITQQVSEQESRGVIPPGQAISEMTMNPKYTLRELDDFYQKEIAVTDEHYTSNAKNVIFMSLMDKGLDEIGSQEQKLFYIEEQLALKSNLPNFQGFYKLLGSCSDFLGQEELDAKAIQFFEKNKREIEKAIQWDSEEEQKQKMEKLIEEYNNFQSQK